MPAPIVVFDLDGTLIDTAPDLVATLNAILAREGLPALPYSEARTLIGNGAKAMLARGFAVRAREVPPVELDRLFADFIDHYSAHVADHSQPFPGLVDALDVLEAAGFRLAVCTNKLEGLSIKLLQTLRLAGRFKAICGQDTFGVQKPDPIVLKRTIASAGGDPKRAVMVGDSATDVLTARGAGVPVVAVNFGYTARPIGEFRPDRVIGHFNELAPAIAEIIGTP
jgi:phosphoglycolate phosphatase